VTVSAAANRGNRWVLAGGVLAALLVVAGVVSGVMQGRDGPPPSRTDRDTASAGAFSPEEWRIIKLLPPGFGAANCERSTDPFADAVASLDCSLDSGSDDPTDARFTLYAEPGALTDDFITTAANMAIARCPGDNPWGPGTWTLDTKAGTVGGKVACGTVDDRPNIAWTRDSQLLLATVNGGANLGALYEWWHRYGAGMQQQ